MAVVPAAADAAVAACAAADSAMHTGLPASKGCQGSQHLGSCSMPHTDSCLAGWGHCAVVLMARELHLECIQELQPCWLPKRLLVLQQSEQALPEACSRSGCCESLGAEGTCEGAPWVFWAGCHRVSSLQQASSLALYLTLVQASGSHHCEAAPAVPEGRHDGAWPG